MSYIYIFVFLILVFVIFSLRKGNRYTFEHELKKSESPIETMMLNALHEYEYKPYAQIPCKSYRIDVALYYKGKKIAIECDGKQFHSSPEQKEHDRIKDSVLKKEKWIVLRFTGSEIYSHMDDCLRMINSVVHRKK